MFLEFRYERDSRAVKTSGLFGLRCLSFGLQHNDVPVYTYLCTTICYTRLSLDMLRQNTNKGELLSEYFRGFSNTELLSLDSPVRPILKFVHSSYVILLPISKPIDTSNSVLSSSLMELLSF